MGTFSDAEKNRMLNAHTGRATMTLNAGVFAKLHTGSPGAAGTTNAAANTTRIAVTFGTNAAAGAISNTADVVWTSVPNAETYSHVSFWDTVGPAGGNFLGADDLPAPVAVTVGNDFKIIAGDIDLAITGTLP